MKNLQKYQNALYLLLSLGLAACIGEGRVTTPEGSGNSVNVSGEGVRVGAPLYGSVCGDEVRVEGFEKSPGRGTQPEEHTLTIVERSQFNTDANLAPTKVMKRGEKYTTDSGCTFTFGGVEPLVFNGVLQEGVTLIVYPSPEGGY